MPVGQISNPLQIRLSNEINKVNTLLSKNLKKLSTGKKINKASDGAASLAIAASLKSENKTFYQSLENIKSSLSMFKIADGSLSQVGDLLMRAKDLAVQSASGSSGEAAQKEFSSIVSEITRISEVTEFSGQKLINGNLAPDSSNQVNVIVGSPDQEANQININILNGSTSAQLGIQDLDISTRENALQAMTALDNAISQNSSNRAGIGGLTNRFAMASSNLGITIENLTSAISGIEDLDYAQETANFSKNQILQSASVTSSAHANAEMVGRIVNLLA